MYFVPSSHCLVPPSSLQYFSLLLSTSPSLHLSLSPLSPHLSLPPPGWCNYPLDQVGFWRRMERVIETLTGQRPRSDDLAWMKRTDWPWPLTLTLTWPAHKQQALTQTPVLNSFPDSRPGPWSRTRHPNMVPGPLASPEGGGKPPHGGAGREGGREETPA